MVIPEQTYRDTTLSTCSPAPLSGPCLIATFCSLFKPSDLRLRFYFFDSSSDLISSWIPKSPISVPN
jgi:hypothetical protein